MGDDVDFNKGDGSRYEESWVNPRLHKVKPKDRDGRWGTPLSFLASSMWKMSLLLTEMRLLQESRVKRQQQQNDLIMTWDLHKFLGQATKWKSLVSCRKKFKREPKTKKKWKLIYLERYALHKQIVDLLRKWEGSQGMGILGWVVLYANEWEEYFCYSGKGLS